MQPLLTAQVVLQINKAVAPVLRGGHAVLFGSLPAGLALLESDIDVVLVEDTPTTPLPSTSGFSQSDRAAVAAQLGKVLLPLPSPLSPPFPPGVQESML